MIKLANYLIQSRRAEEWARTYEPAVTDDMRRKGLKWAQIDDCWHIVCATCGGNCGQCGNTGRVADVPADMNHLIKEIFP